MDLLVSVIITYLACLLKQWHVGLSIGLFIFWCIGNAASFEYIQALHSLARIRDVYYLSDTTFIVGSIFSFKHPFVLGVHLVAGCVFLHMIFRKYRLTRHRYYLLGITLCLIVFNTNWTEYALYPNWKQSHVAALAAYDIITFNQTSDQALHASTQELKHVESAFNADLSGTQLYTASDNKPNVLLIMLEGVSGMYIQTLRNYYGFSYPIALPYLNTLCQKALCYINFITQQSQTNRGEYAILSGDFPKLLSETPKMTEVATQIINRDSFLPNALGNAGYQTAYLQAAPLEFMMKDKFMTKAGFQQIYGAEFFGHAYQKNAWGVDDKAFFEQSIAVLDALNQKPAPWFATLLTVGTHHPYLVPEDYALSNHNDFDRALFYADAALKEFIAQLEHRRLLENTILVITSDEATLPSTFDQTFSNPLLHNWGFLIVVTPNQDQQEIVDTFGQSDIALSITDYLGLDTTKQKFIGRSLFRKYAKPRHVFFGHHHLGRIGVYTKENEVLYCDQNLYPILYQKLCSESLFHFQKTIQTDPPIALLRAASEMARTDGHKDPILNYTLSDANQFPVLGHSERNIFDSQYMSAPADSVLILNVKTQTHILDTGINSVHPTTLNLWTILEAYRPRLEIASIIQQPLLDTLKSELRLLYRTSQPLKWLNCRLLARNLGEKSAMLEIINAELQVMPWSLWPDKTLPKDELKIERECIFASRTIELTDADGFRFSNIGRVFFEDTSVRVHTLKKGYVLYGPYVDIPKHSKIELLMRINGLQGEGQLQFDIAHDHGQHIYFKSEKHQLSSQKTIVFKKTFYINTLLQNAEFRLEVKKIKHDSLTFMIEEVRLKIFVDTKD